MASAPSLTLPSWGGNNEVVRGNRYSPQRGEVGRGARPEIMIIEFSDPSQLMDRTINLLRCFQDAGPTTGFLFAVALQI
jgi:hypothetical protein